MEQLMLDQPVIELKSTRTQQDSRCPGPEIDSLPTAEVGEPEEARDQADPRFGVKQAVGDQTRTRRAAVPEMMPVQELMKHGLVDEPRGPDAEHRPGSGRSSNVAARRRGCAG